MSPASADSPQYQVGSSPLELIGIPWKKHGMIPEDGLGCWGAVRLAANYYGYEIPHFEKSVEQAKNELQYAVERFRDKFDEVDMAEPGDIVLLSIRGMSDVDHIGIMVSTTHFLHSYEKAGVCLSRLTSPVYQRRIRGILRWRK